ncbi:MAG TPA: MFS transporter [Thermomicrobiales bacterium]|nr:MFS transporter [Thermomicrobiales bacterium]
MAANPVVEPSPHLGADFWKFFSGQTISSLGNAVTQFAFPLLVYKLTGSALNLGVTTAVTFVPYLLFGLPIGAWVDRLDRRRLMIVTDLLRALIVGSIPVLAAFDALSVWHIYLAAFLASTLGIAFDAAQFAAIPSLVGTGDLVTANGRILASYSAAGVLGPPIAGFLVARTSAEFTLTLDAASFVVSAVSLLLIQRSFNTSELPKEASSIRRDVIEGLRYVLGHPVLRNISLMMAMINFLGSTTVAQLIFFAKERFDASDQQVSWLFSAGSAGVIVLSLAAGPLRHRYSFSRVALTALVLDGLLTILFAAVDSYWLALLIWAVISGCGILFNINTGSLRQAIVPNQLLGRVISIAGVLAWSAIPLGTLSGGWLIDRTGNVTAVYAAIGALTAIIAVAFAFSPIGHAERYLPTGQSEAAPSTGAKAIAVMD